MPLAGVACVVDAAAGAVDRRTSHRPRALILSIEPIGENINWSNNARTVGKCFVQQKILDVLLNPNAFFKREAPVFASDNIFCTVYCSVTVTLCLSRFLAFLSLSLPLSLLRPISLCTVFPYTSSLSNQLHTP